MGGGYKGNRQGESVLMSGAFSLRWGLGIFHKGICLFLMDEGILGPELGGGHTPCGQESGPQSPAALS